MSATVSTIETNEPDSASASLRPALVVAHPGHELRLYGWLEAAHPVTFVLTRGDGHDGVSRVPSTERVLGAAGAVPGSIFGRLNDADIYAALLRVDVDLFVALLDELIEAMTAANINAVVADAAEGYNPSHDVCSHLAAAAAASLRRSGRAVRHFDFPLVASPDLCPDALRQTSVWLQLDDETFARKMQAAHSYPELALEVARALAANGAEAFRTECLRPYVPPLEPVGIPFYEEYGDRQVAAGKYRDVIRYQQHVAPVRAALWKHSGLHQG